jgi:hypothetical protein
LQDPPGVLFRHALFLLLAGSTFLLIFFLAVLAIFTVLFLLFIVVFAFAVLILFGILLLRFLRQDIFDIVFGVGVGRVQVQGFLVIFQRLVGLLLPEGVVAQIVEGLASDERVFAAECPLVFFCRVVKTVGLVQGVAEIEMDHRV